MSSYTSLPDQTEYDGYKTSYMFNPTFVQSEVCLAQGQGALRNLNVLPPSRDNFNYMQQIDSMAAPQVSTVDNNNISPHWTKQEHNRFDQDISFLFDYDNLMSTSNNNTSNASISTVNTGSLETRNSNAFGPDPASSPSSSTATDDNNMFFYNHQQMNPARRFSCVDSEIEALDQISISHFSQKCALPMSPHSAHKSAQSNFFTEENSAYMPSVESSSISVSTVSMAAGHPLDYSITWQQNKHIPALTANNQTSHCGTPFVSTRLSDASGVFVSTSISCPLSTEKNIKKRTIADDTFLDSMCMPSVVSSYSEPIPTSSIARHWSQPPQTQASFDLPRKRTRSLRNSSTSSPVENSVSNNMPYASYDYTSPSDTHMYNAKASNNNLNTESFLKNQSSNLMTHAVSPTPTPEVENITLMNRPTTSQYLLPNNHFLSDAMPRRQKLRYEGDYYTPKWVRFTGHLKEGYCDSCHPGKWLQLKNSAYWYHKQFYHGISSVSGKPFMKPIEQRMGKGDMVEGLCHQCHRYVPACNGKKKNNYMLWYRHAHKCHLYDKPKVITSQKVVVSNMPFSQEAILPQT